MSHELLQRDYHPKFFHVSSTIWYLSQVYSLQEYLLFIHEINANTEEYLICGKHNWAGQKMSWKLILIQELSWFQRPTNARWKYYDGLPYLSNCVASASNWLDLSFASSKGIEIPNFRSLSCSRCLSSLSYILEFRHKKLGLYKRKTDWKYTSLSKLTLLSAHCRYNAISSWQNGSISLICRPATHNQNYYKRSIITTITPPLRNVKKKSWNEDVT